MLTIGRLARYAGVSTKTVRFYHAKGLLPEPERDSSGYRRYTAQHAVDLIKIRTLVEAGVPLARIQHLRAASDEDLEQALQELDVDLTGRIRTLQDTRRRLRRLAAGGALPMLPPQVTAHLDRLEELGFSARWVAMETDLWVLVFATHPDTALDLFHDQAQALADEALRQIYLDYDRLHDLDDDDPRVDALAERIVAATRNRYPAGELPGHSVDSDMPALIQGAVNASSPAWRRLDSLVRERLSH